MGSTCGWGKFGQNGQELLENYKIKILGAKQREGQANFWVVGESPQFPLTRGNPVGLVMMYLICHVTSQAHLFKCL